MRRAFTIKIIQSMALVLVLLLSCQENDQPIFGVDVDDPNPSGENPASLDAIDPPEGFLKDVITISGSGFDPEAEFNLVNFGDRVGVVLEASSSELVVETPNLQDTTVIVRVAVKGSELWSNTLDFTFKPTLAVIDADIAWANGIAVDSDQNVYVGSAGDGAVYKITPAGDKSEFAAVDGLSGALHWGPEGYLYVSTGWNGTVMRVSADGATVEEYAPVEGVVDFDWDADGNMYMVVNGEGITARDSGGNITAAAEGIGAAKNCRVFDGYVYVSKIWDSAISRFPLNGGGSLGAEEIYLDVSEDGYSPSSFEFDSGGTMYWSHAWDSNLYTVTPDGESGEVLYEGQLTDDAGSPLRYMYYHGKILYMAFPGWADIGTAMSAYIGVEQAPRYGEN